MIHISHGMIRELVVREEDGGGKPPTDGIPIQVDREGIHMQETPTTGRHRFGVDYFHSAKRQSAPARFSASA